METIHASHQNRLLAAISGPEFPAIGRHLELVALPIGTLLYEPGRKLLAAYFPTTAIASLFYVTASGAMAETAGVGREGMVGTSLIMGADTMPSSAVVHTGGHAYRLDRHVLRQEFDRAGLLHRLLLRYTQALMTEIAQTAACNRHHVLEQRLARWLLLTLDRGSSFELAITQDMVAGMLGVRREGVTEAAGCLQRAGAIHCRRGHISLVSRISLEARSCECYAVIRQEVDRLLPHAG